MSESTRDYIRTETDELVDEPIDALRANPLQTPEVIKPEWYFYVTFRWLKLFGQTFAVLSMGFIVFTMFVWPWIDARLQKIPGCKEASVHIGIVAVCLIIGPTGWDAAVAH